MARGGVLMKRVATVFAISVLELGCDGKTVQYVPPSNVGPDGGWVCGSLDAEPPVSQCDDQTKAACQEWAQSLIHNGVAHAGCHDISGSSAPFRCPAADKCSSVYPYACSCGTTGGTCDTNQVCVSDTAGATPHCVAACSQ